MKDESEFKQIGVDTLISMRQLNTIEHPSPNSSFDPYQIMINKNSKGDDESVHPPVIEYDINEVIELQEFCNRYGIVATNFKNMNPKSILNMLKQKIGVVDEQMNRKILFD
jgi:hypothetical protein